jgi:hypothetical protein
MTAPCHEHGPEDHQQQCFLPTQVHCSAPQLLGYADNRHHQQQQQQTYARHRPSMAKQHPAQGAQARRSPSPAALLLMLILLLLLAFHEGRLHLVWKWLLGCLRRTCSRMAVLQPTAYWHRRRRRCCCCRCW